MFKKLIHIIISFLLLTVTAGYSVSKHYCGNNLVSVSVSHEAESCCDMEGETGCCRNETKSFHLEEDFVISPVLEIDLVKSIDLFAIYFIVFENNFFFELTNDFVITESPPPLKTQTKLSRLQVYLC